jgi:hypothetical protein
LKRAMQRRTDLRPDPIRASGGRLVAAVVRPETPLPSDRKGYRGNFGAMQQKYCAAQ